MKNVEYSSEIFVLQSIAAENGFDSFNGARHFLDVALFKANSVVQSYTSNEQWIDIFLAYRGSCSGNLHGLLDGHSAALWSEEDFTRAAIYQQGNFGEY